MSAPAPHEAMIETAEIAPGHDGAAELMLRLVHPNGAREVLSLDAEAGFRLMYNCGAPDLAALAGQPWRRMLEEG